MTKITKNIILSVLALALGILLIAGPSLSADIKRGGTITVGIDTGPLGWDPQMDQAFSTWNHYEQVYESLVRFNHKMEIVPSLATSWELPDKLTFIFKIRKGVKFHNGREMDADDIKYSLERMKNPKISVRPSFTEPIKSIELLDKYTVKITMSVPYPTFLPFLAYGRYAAIVPREVIEKHGNLKAVAVGTGPFKVKEYVPGDYTVFERNRIIGKKVFPG
ncbi:MAG: ABC transporter substrate-binding protein [Planctomycetota bacterium]